MSKPWINRAAALLSASLAQPNTEHNELDWKLDLSPNKERLTEHLIALANYPGGGFLTFGINALGIKVGGVDEAKIVGQLGNLARQAVDPPVTIDHHIESIDGVNVLFVQVAESPVKPVRVRGKPVDETFIRSGGTTRKASRQDVASLMLHSRTPRWEDLPASNYIDDTQILAALDFDTILTLLERPRPTTIGALREQMFKEGFVTSSEGSAYITNLGAVAAAQKLDEFPDLRRKAVRIIVYDGRSKAKAKGEFEGTRGYAIRFQALLSHLLGLLPRSEVIEDALRQKRTLYPEIALREIIANALIHQDFTVQGTGPLIEVFDDRIEISNPGGLLPSKQLDRLIGAQPESRNEKLAAAFRRYKICEERGSGLIKAGIAVELYGLPPIRFESGSNFVKVTLFAPRTFAEMTPRERLEACYQHCVLKYFSDSVMTNKSFRTRLKMPEHQRSMVSAIIQEAQAINLIKSSDPENKSKKFAEYIPYWA